jgi:hypothetical protein
MSSTGTQTTTYTIADIQKVVDNFAADFSMMAQATGLWARDNVEKTVFDLKVFAENGYLIDVNIILKDRYGRQIRAAVYKVSESAKGWISERPGNNLWPRMPDGSLKVVATLTNAWWNMTGSEKERFIRDRLYGSWPITTEETSFLGLASSPGQRYASNGYGWERKNYN